MKRDWKSFAVPILLIALIVCLVVPIFAPGKSLITVGWKTVDAITNPDYTFSGANDSTPMQNALNALPSTGGEVKVITPAVTQSTINFTATVTRAIHNVTISGVGQGTSFVNNGVTPIFTVGGNNWVFRDIKTDAGGINFGVYTNYTLMNVQLGATYYALYSPGSIRGTSITDTGLTAGRNVYTGVGGLLSSEAGYEYNAGTDTFTVSNIVAPTGRSSTYVIAASNATATEKAQADYVCDGTADNVQIQAANDALPSGGIIQLLGPTFNLAASGLPVGNESSIRLSSNIWLKGEGKYTTKLVIGNGVQENAICAISKSGVRISDLEIDGNKTGNVETAPAADSKQNNIYFSATTKSSVDNVYTHDAIFHGIFNYQGTYNSFTKNECAANRYRPIHAHTTVNYNYYGFNYIHGNGSADDSTFGGLFVLFNGAHDNVIEGNIIEDELSIGGIHVDGGTAAVYDNTIIGNTIDVTADANVMGIYIASTSNNLSRLTISGNTIKGGRHGISEASGTMDKLVIANNIIYGMGGKGILFAGTLSDGNISNNCINADDEEGIVINAGTRLNINGNTIVAHNTYSGIRLKSTTNSIIQANQFYNNKWAIDETTDGGNSGNLIADNILVTMAQNPPMVLQSKDVHGNHGYIAPGEVRTSSGVLTAGIANAITFAWNNPEIQDVLVKKVVVEITTGSATANSVIDAGIADDVTGTNRGVEFFDDLDANDVDINDSWVGGDGGTQTKWVLCQDSVSATDDWIVGQILVADAAALVGKYYIEYSGR